jgi:hypothetical protein
VSFGEPFDQSAVAPIRSGQSDLVEELGGAKVEATEAFSTGLLSEGTGEEGFAHSCRTCDEKILVTADPLTGGEAEDKGFFDSSRSSVVDVLQGGLKFEFGVLEEAFETFVLLPDPLAVGQHGKAFLEGEIPEGRLFELFFKAFGHPDKFHRVEFIKGLFIEHDFSLS